MSVTKKQLHNKNYNLLQRLERYKVRYKNLLTEHQVLLIRNPDLVDLKHELDRANERFDQLNQDFNALLDAHLKLKATLEAKERILASFTVITPQDTL